MKNALLFLEAMIRGAKLQAISPQLISVIKAIIFSSTSSDVRQNAYFCILALGLEAEVTHETGESMHMCTLSHQSIEGATIMETACRMESGNSLRSVNSKHVLFSPDTSSYHTY